MRNPTRRTLMLRKYAITCVCAIGICAAAFYAWYAWRYPYGWSHCCDKLLYLALTRYADVHKGVFPSGEATPEASLSLLYWNDEYLEANLLRGKTVPEQVVQAVLDRGELLTPETCGWHYVQGLTSDDDPALALFWDKAGLGHNGQRLPDAGHMVWFVDGNHEFISQAHWSEFLERQEELHSRN